MPMMLTNGSLQLPLASSAPTPLLPPPKDSHASPSRRLALLKRPASGEVKRATTAAALAKAAGPSPPGRAQKVITKQRGGPSAFRGKTYLFVSSN